MRTSQYLLFTIREIPTDSKVISHQLMLRAGMIRKLSSGLYTWLPTGLRVLKKIENIVREEMNNVGSIEISMPIVQPANLWKESGRLEKYGPELLRFFDRSKRPFVLAPTHEEVITHLIRKELNSYKQFPLNFFQIQTKFRDEARPCFGVIRSREFLMKDAYSFHTSKKSLKITYKKMYEAYIKIFTRIGLNFRVVKADTGSIGGSISHEFQALPPKWEDNIIFPELSNYTSHTKRTRTLSPPIPRSVSIEETKLIDTTDVENIANLVKQINSPIKKTVKTLLVKAVKGSACPIIILLIRSDHQLNKVKVEKLPQVAVPLTFATEEDIRSIVDANSSFLNFINIPIPIIIDHTVASMKDFSIFDNFDKKDFFNITWDYDVATPIVADIKNVNLKSSNLDKNNEEILLIKRNIEIGHIFQLGIKYSQAMNAIIQNENGENQILTMGCYGIGLTRVVAATIEQNHDERGIVWPDNIAPYQIGILPINMYKSYRVKELAERLYTDLRDNGIDILIDDRKESVGVMFADMELIGIPHLIVIGDQNLDNNNIEYIHRRNREKKIIKIDEILSFLYKIIKS